MKKSDIAMLILIASISILAAYFIGNAVFGSIEEEPVSAKVIDRYESTIEEPNERIFNDQAINPTVEIVIGQESQ